MARQLNKNNKTLETYATTGVMEFRTKDNFFILHTRIIHKTICIFNIFLRFYACNPRFIRNNLINI